jgi:hypothetical protein
VLTTIGLSKSDLPEEEETSFFCFSFHQGISSFSRPDCTSGGGGEKLGREREDIEATTQRKTVNVCMFTKALSGSELLSGGQNGSQRFTMATDSSQGWRQLQNIGRVKIIVHFFSEHCSVPSWAFRLLADAVKEK